MYKPNCSLKTNAKLELVTLNATKKSAMFCSAKDKIPTRQEPNVIYAKDVPDKMI